MSDINALPSIRVHRNLHKRAAWLKAVKGGATHEQASASIGGQWVRSKPQLPLAGSGCALQVDGWRSTWTVWC